MQYMVLPQTALASKIEFKHKSVLSIYTHRCSTEELKNIYTQSKLNLMICNYNNSENYHRPTFYLKYLRDWIISPSSGGAYSVASNQ
jgi:hypothetical protein